MSWCCLCSVVLFTITLSPVGVLFSPATSLVKMASQPPQNFTTELAELNREVKTKVIHHIEYKHRDGGCLWYRYRVRSVSESAWSEETAGSSTVLWLHYSSELVPSPTPTNTNTLQYCTSGYFPGRGRERETNFYQILFFIFFFC